MNAGSFSYDIDFFFKVSPLSTSHLTCGGDVATEPEEKLISLAHGDLRRGLREAAVPLCPQFGQLPAEVSAGQGGHQDGVRLVLPGLEDDGDRVAADRLLQLLCQRGEMAGQQRGEETHHQQPEGMETAAKL